MPNSDKKDRYDLLKSHVAELDQQINELEAECPKRGLAAETDTRRLIRDLERQKEEDQTEMDQIKNEEAHNTGIGL